MFGRGSRVRKDVVYCDDLTERQWLKVSRKKKRQTNLHHINHGYNEKVGTHEGTSPRDLSPDRVPLCELRYQNSVPTTSPANSNWFFF